MKKEIDVYATNDIKFSQIYGNGNYAVILKFVPYTSLTYDEAKEIEELLKHRVLKLTIEVKDEWKT